MYNQHMPLSLTMLTNFEFVMMYCIKQVGQCIKMLVLNIEHT